MLEDGGCLVLTARSHASVTAGMMQVVACQLGNMQRVILFRREDVIGFAVIIDEECHISRHLARIEVTLQIFIEIQR